MCQNGQGELPRAMGSTRMVHGPSPRDGEAQPSRISARLGRKLCEVKIIVPDSASFGPGSILARCG